MNINIQLKKAQKLFREHKLNLAKDIYQKILISWPNQIEALQNLSMIYVKQNDLKAAEKLLDRLYLLVQDKNLIINYSSLKLNLGKYSEVVKISNENESLDSLKLNTIRALRYLKKYNECLDLIKVYKSKNPINYMLIIENILVLNQLKQYKYSIKMLQDNFEIFNNNEDLFYMNLGICYQNENQEFKAIESFKRILTSSKYYSESQIQIGKSLSKLNKLAELENFVTTQRNNNVRSVLLTFVAEAYIEDHNQEKALESYKNAINDNPENYDALTGIAELYLKQQNYNDGFYYWRWRVRKGIKQNKRFYSDDSEIMSIDKYNKINVLAEQGIGDELFYLRLIPLLQDKVKEKLKLYIDRRLIEVIKANLIDIDVYDIEDYKKNNLYDEVSLNCGSLPRFIDIDKKNLKELKKFKIKETFKFDKIQKLIGISWISKNEQFEKSKSIELAKIIKSIPDSINHQIVNLQYGDVNDEITKINESRNINIIDTEYDLYNDINKLFELVSKCEIVITVCNFTAHVAGSLGVKTYLLIPKSKGRLWYWYGDKNDWYESVEYLHQSQDGDWGDVMENLSEKLRIKFS
jgi:tetratricopeptide (TPR) repeat protein